MTVAAAALQGQCAQLTCWQPADVGVARAAPLVGPRWTKAVHPGRDRTAVALPALDRWPGSWRRVGAVRTVTCMPTSVNVFRELVEELRAGGPHRLALTLSSPGSLILPLAVNAGRAVTCENIDSTAEGVSPSPGAPSRSQN